MATGTFTQIRQDLDRAVHAIDQALSDDSIDRSAVRQELDRLRALSKRIEMLIERLKETWG